MSYVSHAYAVPSGKAEVVWDLPGDRRPQLGDLDILQEYLAVYRGVLLRRGAPLAKPRLPREARPVLLRRHGRQTWTRWLSPPSSEDRK